METQPLFLYLIKANITTQAKKSADHARHEKISRAAAFIY